MTTPTMTSCFNLGGKNGMNEGARSAAALPPERSPDACVSFARNRFELWRKIPPIYQFLSLKQNKTNVSSRQ